MEVVEWRPRISGEKKELRNQTGESLHRTADQLVLNYLDRSVHRNAPAPVLLIVLPGVVAGPIYSEM